MGVRIHEEYGKRWAQCESVCHRTDRYELTVDNNFGDCCIAQDDTVDANICSLVIN